MQLTLSKNLARRKLQFSNYLMHELKDFDILFHKLDAERIFFFDLSLSFNGKKAGMFNTAIFFEAEE
jgi:hypothetical protein